MAALFGCCARNRPLQNEEDWQGCLNEFNGVLGRINRCVIIGSAVGNAVGYGISQYATSKLGKIAQCGKTPSALRAGICQEEGVEDLQKWLKVISDNGVVLSTTLGCGVGLIAGLVTETARYVQAALHHHDE